MEALPNLPTANTPVDEEDNSSDLSDEDFLDDSDEFGDEAIVDTGGFTFLDPLSAGVNDFLQSTDEQLADMAIFQGQPKDPNVQLRFVIGIKELNRFPGKGPGEVDRYKRSWLKLMAFSRKFHWRRIFHNSFEGDYYHESVPFTIDGVEWKTVTHYLLGMLYANTPEYASKYSLRDRQNKIGWWGKVESALDEHKRNMKVKVVLPDPNYRKYLDGYLQRALLAKFSQYPKLKQALLLTEDAVFAVREGPKKISDLPALSKVRDIIRQDPTIIYKGDSVPKEYDLPEIPIIASAEELNFNYVDLQSVGGTPEYQKLVAIGLIGGNVHHQAIYEKADIDVVMRSISPNSILNQEAIETCDQVVFLASGAYRLEINKLFDMSSLTFIRRHIYALERITDNKNERIMIAAQRSPCSQYATYLHFYANLHPRIPAVGIYLEPLLTSADGVWDYAIQIVSDRQDPLILNYLRSLIVQFISPGTEAEGDVQEEENEDED